MTRAVVVAKGMQTRMVKIVDEIMKLIGLNRQQ